MPKMRHKSGGPSIEVAPDRVAMYESQGWQKVAAPKKADPKPDPKK